MPARGSLESARPARNREQVLLVGRPRCPTKRPLVGPVRRDANQGKHSKSGYPLGAHDGCS